MSRKIVYVEIDEEVTSIYDSIKRNQSKIVYLVIPKKAAIYQSGVNLRILKSKAEKLGKKIILVTQDTIGKKLGEKMNFTVLSKIPIKNVKKQKGIMNIEPIAAQTNQVARETPFITKQNKKVSIKELVKNFKGGNINKTVYTDDDKAVLMPFPQPGKKFLIGVVLFSLILFIVITYIALPGATIYIKPKTEILEQPVNITLADYQTNNNELNNGKNNHMLPSYPIETVFEKIITFETLSREFEGQNAKGRIKIINTANKDWPLIDRTQFVTDDGVVFRTKNWVNVPAKTEEENGVAWVDVETDPFDIYHNVIGDRGNIGPAKFKIRKLSAYNQERIWGESTEAMTGGITKFKNVIKKDDLEIAKKKIEAEILESAREYLKGYILESNRLNKSHLVLINSANYINSKILDIKVPDDLIGKEQDKFEMYAKIRVESIAFDYDKFIDILKRDLKTRVHPDMCLKEETINEDSINYQIIDENKALKRLKLSVFIKGVQEYAIQPTNESGVKFIKRLKEKIIGLNKKEAENYISNLREVAEVEISVWPLWNTSLPAVSENIVIKLKDY